MSETRNMPALAFYILVLDSYPVAINWFWGREKTRENLGARDVMGRVKGKIATGRTRPVEGNKPLTEGDRSFFKLLTCCFGQFFTKVFCQVFNNDCALISRLKVAFYGSFLNFLIHSSIQETGRFPGS